MLKHELAAESIWTRIERLRINSLDRLAPVMRNRVETFVEACKLHYVDIPTTVIDGVSTNQLPLDVRVFETLREDELQQIYFDQGTTKAKTAALSWHGYGLAVDVISQRFSWFAGAEAIAMWPNRATRERVTLRWFTKMANVACRFGLSSGINWKTPDMPHLYFTAPNIKPTPGPWARARYVEGDLRRVWRAVGATMD